MAGKVILLVEDNPVCIRVRPCASGVNGYVRKPIDFAEFTDLTAQLGIINKEPGADEPAGD